MENQKQDFFADLYAVNVNEYTESKNGLTYLTWAYAIAEVCKRYNQDFDYEIKKFGENQLPYVHDEKTGYMVFTSITLCGKTRECWLPVMDNRNKAMLECTMFDINKTIMRCLTKNLALFGLGLYIYAGEDLPESEVVKEELATPEQIEEIKALVSNIPNLLRWAKVGKLEDLTKSQAQTAINSKKGAQQ